MRNGKIARLPLAIRDQLNQRLQDGEKGESLVQWLNSQPAVQAAMKAHFASQPISPQNLSEWTQGGYRDWLAQNQAADAALSLIEGTTELAQAAKGPLNERLRAFCAARLALELHRLDSLQDGPEKRLLWRLLFSQMATLSRSDNAADWVQLERERLKFQRDNALAEREKQFVKWGKKAVNQAKLHPPPLTEEDKQRRLKELLEIA
ncbi:MAG: hypothetical protein ABSH38_07305 [Verrucomicrobiota bacterium]|jgi:hypothetical protein